MSSPPFFESGDSPLLVYTSTPFRGLDILLHAFPLIRAEVPGCRLKVYSSMAVYQIPREQDEYRNSYQHCQSLDGAEYVGSLPQEELAIALNEADILAYPNIFAETSCISVMEAMALSCLVVTSDLGAFPETTGGHGFLIAPGGKGIGFVHDYARMMVDVVHQAVQDPAAFRARIQQQLEYIRKDYTWHVRAREWEDWLLMNQT